MRSVLDLPQAHKRLSPAARKRFDRIFSFSLDEGRLRVPEGMVPWAEKQFGSAAKLERQPILKVTDNVVFEGALFNQLRAERPMHNDAPVSREELLQRAASEPFADPEKNTPEDAFGRVYGKSEVTASNVAKYDALHGLVIFAKADPLAFTEEELIDHYETALSWIAAAHNERADALYPVVGWNCLWKAGASLVHGHLQTLLGTGSHYATAEHYRAAGEAYRRKYESSYWDDLFKVHESLGLGVERQGVRVFASLTPKKEKEVVLLGKQADRRLFSSLYRVLDAYRGLGVESFNVAMLLPPLDGSWKGFPVIVRVVDRGALSSQTTDVAFVELYLGQSVVSSDQAKVWDAVSESLGRKGR